MVLQVAFMFIYLDTRKANPYSLEVQATAVIFIFVTTVLGAVLLKKIWQVNNIWCVYFLLTTVLGYSALAGMINFSVFGTLSVGLLMFFLPVMVRDIPYYPSPSREIAMALGTTPPGIDKKVRVADLGAGFGLLGIRLANDYGAKIDCFEISPICFAFSKILIKILAKRGQCRAIFGSFWSLDFGEYEVIFNYLSPSVMARLAEKWEDESCSRGRLVSYEFPLPRLMNRQDISVEEITLTKASLYIYSKVAY